MDVNIRFALFNLHAVVYARRYDHLLVLANFIDLLLLLFDAHRIYPFYLKDQLIGRNDQQ